MFEAVIFSVSQQALQRGREENTMQGHNKCMIINPTRAKNCCSRRSRTISNLHFYASHPMPSSAHTNGVYSNYHTLEDQKPQLFVLRRGCI